MGISVFPAAGGGVTQKVTDFTSTGTFTAPSNCYSVEVLLVGGGGGGGSARAVGADVRNSGGGGGGGTVRKAFLPVTPGTSYTVTIGAAGAGGAGSGAAGSVGGDSSFGSLLTALGGGSGSGKNESTNVMGTSRGTGGGVGVPAVSSGNQAPASSGGGAGGPAYYHTTQTQPFGANYVTTMRTATSVQGSSNTLGVGGAGIPPVDSAITSGSFTIIGGIGIDGYGAGGLGAVATSQTNFIISGYSGVPLVYLTAQGQTATGGSGQANSGNGGNGGAVWADGNSAVGNGGAGGSGFCRITYWS